MYENTTFKDLPEWVQNFGGFGDEVIDNFGLPLPICSIKDGFIPAAASRALDILGLGHIQKNIVPPLHKVGFEKVKIPKDIYARCVYGIKFDSLVYFFQ